MIDARLKKLAKILVGYSVKVRRGDVIQLNFGAEAAPLALEVYTLIVKKGAMPRTNIVLPGFSYAFYKNATKAQLEAFPKIAMYEARNSDGVISIGAPYNSKEFSNIDPKRVAMRNKAVHPISGVVLKKHNWCGCEYPTHSLAQEAEMSLAEFEKFYFDAVLQDWPGMLKGQKKIKKVLDKGKQVRIVGDGTDLTFGIKGRTGLTSTGHFNMPDGEVFMAPEEKTVEGHVKFSFPSIRYGKEVDGIYLEFRKGKIVKATAEKNQATLRAMIDTDKGSKYLGEFGIGTNYGIKRHIKNILFDEKIGGTIHLAIGMAYKEGGGKNDSAVHWDLIKDLRKGGKVFVDGKLLQKNGRFTL